MHYDSQKLILLWILISKSKAINMCFLFLTNDNVSYTSTIWNITVQDENNQTSLGTISRQVP